MQDHDDEIIVMRHHAIGLVRRLEAMPIFLDPAFDVG
jgi:hypothetical protein